MQRGQHHVTGLRGLDRDFGGFQVADFADHDHVRILAQEGFERGRECEAGLVVDVDLVDARQLDFRRIFRSGNVDVGLVEDIEAGVERHGFTGTGGAGDQYHAVGALHGSQQRLFLPGLVAQRLDPELRTRRIENPHDDLFAVERGQRADPEVDRTRLRQHHLHPAVLRHAFFCDIQARQHLDARCDLVLDRHRRLRHFVQDAVAAVADAVELLVGFEVDVGRAGVDRVEHDLLQVAHHRCIVDLDTAGVRLAARFLVGEIEVEVLGVEHGQRVVRRLAHFLDKLAEFVVFDHDRLDSLSGLEFDFIQRLQLGRVGRADIQFVAPLIERHHAAFLHQPGVEQPLRQALGIHRGQIHEGITEGDGRKLSDLLGLETLAPDQFGDERVARLGGAFPDAFGIVFGQPAMVDHGARQPG